MMQAAQLAAEAAMQEAAREASSGRSSQPQERRIHQDSIMDMDSSNPHLGMDPDQIAFLKAMQAAAEMGDHASTMHELGMLGLGGAAANESVQSLLHMLRQQEQDSHRPDEHYLTIAQNGTSIFSTLVPNMYCLSG